MAKFKVNDGYSLKFEIDRITASFDIFCQWFTDQNLNEKETWDYTADVLDMLWEQMLTLREHAQTILEDNHYIGNNKAG
jgi:hypothetical protein